MKIDKAIEILSDSANSGMTTFNQGYKDAQRLGIEALKFKRAIRAHTVDDFDALLPGETKD